MSRLSRRPPFCPFWLGRICVSITRWRPAPTVPFFTHAHHEDQPMDSMGDHLVGAFIGVSTFLSCTEDASTSFGGLVYG
jgi:hypothetical protein